MDYQNPIWEASLHRRWIGGIPAPVWLRERDRIGKLIKEWGLKPLPEKTFQAAELRMAAGPKTLPKLPPMPGGIKIAHLHFDGDVFMLNDEQWQKFAGGVIVEGMKAKLNKTRSISFEQAMELSTVVDSLP